ncbi:hypothetical protein QJS10_CPB22g00027 [Acorus calamus]|uniref:Uncharacterized protein n=1 Tax=Acorus calamus TaxID=4465 RepID=A0AAV9C170_ACOCL|nr:hypothetical protein QJS10_CPB22g00027 [Acorus calamus]
MALLFPQTEIVVINGRITKPSIAGGVRRRRSLTVGRVGAPLRTADREARVSETDSKEVYRYFSAPTPEKPSKKGGGDDEDRRDYYVNTGYAIRTLREEYPEIFYREPTFDIYSVRLGRIERERLGKAACEWIRDAGKENEYGKL